MGIRVSPYESYSDVLEYVGESIATRRRSYCVAINPEKVYRALKDSRVRAALDQADIRICDGIGIVLAARLLYGRRIRRCTGVDLFFELIAAAARNRWKVFLLGASAESNATACSKLRQRYPGLRIVGRRDGYFQDPMGVVRQINESQPDLLFVAMGSPRQELWIAKHREALKPPFCMGVGGSFDVVAGKAKRAPGIFRKTGTEFIFRLATQPRRWRRQLALPLFVAALLQSKFFRHEVSG